LRKETNKPPSIENKGDKNQPVRKHIKTKKKWLRARQAPRIRGGKKTPPWDELRLEKGDTLKIGAKGGNDQLGG